MLVLELRFWWEEATGPVEGQLASWDWRERGGGEGTRGVKRDEGEERGRRWMRKKEGEEREIVLGGWKQKT